MNSFRKIVGIVLMVFIAVPVLIGVIWAVGITRAVVSPELLSDMPREVIAEIPDLVDEMLAAMQAEDFTTDENARQWIKAISEAETSPKELMEEIGLLSWLQNELSSSLQEIGEILRGEVKPMEITLNMRPLKKALQHKAIDRYVTEIISRFPPCDVEQLEEWQHPDYGHHELISLPACQPDPLIVQEALAEWRQDVEDEIADGVYLFEGARYMPRGLSTARTVVSLTYLLFLIPAAFIAIGALIAAAGKPGFFKWFGLTTIIGGLIPLAMALFAKNIVPLAVDWFPYEYSHTVSIQFQELVIDKIGGILLVIVDQLFSPVIAVAGTVCVVGLVMFALSFAFTSETGEVVPEEQATAVEKEIESKPEETPEIEDEETDKEESS